MPVPSFESEIRRAAAAQKPAVIPKQQLHAEVGTSVAPRQRPKGSVSSQNLPLVLPSSPSPRTTISPSPQVLQSNDPNFDTCDKSMTTTPVSPYALKPKTNIIQQNDKTPIKTTATENLFEAKFSDSFHEPANLPQTPSSLMGSKKDVQSPTSPLHQHVLNAPKFISGHRRNVSDTSAFNK